MRIATHLAAVVPALFRGASGPGVWLLVAALLAGPAGLWARPPRYVIPGQEAPVALLTVGRTRYLVTAGSVFELRGPQAQRRYQSAAPIRCALAADSGGLWLGTGQGLLRVGPGRGSGAWRARPLPLPAPAGPAPVTALLRDARGTVWVGAAGYGAYTLAGGQWQPSLRVPDITAGLATADSAVWLGTNLGLHRYQRGAWTRYNEEGVANYEIPDNLVSQLLLDNGGSLWVLMSDAMTVFENPTRAGSGAGHLPVVKYLGQPGNAVYGVAYLPGRGHVFATELGLLLLPTQAPGELAHFDAATDRVETPRVLVPLTVAGTPLTGPCLLQAGARRRLWVGRPGQVQVVRAQDLRPAAPSIAERPGAQGEASVKHH